MTAHLQHTSDEPSHEPQISSVDHERATAGDTGSTPAIQFDVLLELLGDDYACDVLRALADCPTTARELTEQFEMSRPTVYRRLERLQEAGIVGSTMQPDRDGHHRQAFHLVVDQIELQFHEDGIDGAVLADTPADD